MCIFKRQESRKFKNAPSPKKKTKTFDPRKKLDPPSLSGPPWALGPEGMLSALLRPGPPFQMHPLWVGSGWVSALAEGSVPRPMTLPHRRDWVPTFGCLVSQPPRLLTIPEPHQGAGEREPLGGSGGRLRRAIRGAMSVPAPTSKTSVWDSWGVTRGLEDGSIGQ